MTLSTTSNKVSFSGNGSTTVFAYNFKILANSDLKVYIRSATGTETLKTISTHYNVSGVGSASGGNVTFTGGNTPTNTETVIIQRVVALTQTHDYVENDPFPAESHEEGLDRLTMHVQQIQEEVDRSIKASVTNTISSSEFSNSPTDRANKIFGFDSTGDISVTTNIGTNRGNWASGTDYNERDLVKDTSTNNVFQVNTTHTSSGSQPLTSNANSAKYTLLVDSASASTSATASANSATASATSATASASSATASASSATQSANSATASAGSATTASNHVSTASGHVTTASNHKTTSQRFATHTGSTVTDANTGSDTGLYSAKHYADLAETKLDNFDDTYLGSKSSAPTVDNDGDALATGALYWNSSNNNLYVWNGSAWVQGAFSSGGFLSTGNNLSDLTNPGNARTNLGLGTSAVLNVGTSANNIPQLDGNAKLPAVDGSQLTGLASGGTINMTIGSGSSAVSAGTSVTRETNGEAKKIEISTTTTNNTFATTSVSTAIPAISSRTSTTNNSADIGASCDGRYLMAFNTYQTSNGQYNYWYLQSFVCDNSGGFTASTPTQVQSYGQFGQYGHNARQGNFRIEYLKSVNSDAGGTFLCNSLYGAGYGQYGGNRIFYFITVDDAGGITVVHQRNIGNDMLTQEGTYYNNSGGFCSFDYGVHAISGNTFKLIAHGCYSHTQDWVGHFSKNHLVEWSVTWNGSSYALTKTRGRHQTSENPTSMSANYHGEMMIIPNGGSNGNEVNIITFGSAGSTSGGNVYRNRYTYSGTDTFQRNSNTSVVSSIGNRDGRRMKAIHGKFCGFLAMGFNTSGQSSNQAIKSVDYYGNFDTDVQGFVSNGGDAPNGKYDYINNELVTTGDTASRKGFNNHISSYPISSTDNGASITVGTPTNVSDSVNNHSGSSNSTQAYKYQHALGFAGASVSLIGETSLDGPYAQKGRFWLYATGNGAGQPSLTGYKAGVMKLTTNVTATNKAKFFGFAQEAGSAGSSIKVMPNDTEGLESNVSGLTHGTTYYVADNGTLTSSAGTDNPLAGQSIGTGALRLPTKSVSAGSGSDPEVFCSAINVKTEGTPATFTLSIPNSITASNVRSYVIRFYGVGFSTNTGYNCRFKPYNGGYSVLSGNTWYNNIHYAYNGQSNQVSYNNWSSYLSPAQWGGENIAYGGNTYTIQDYDSADESPRLSGEIWYENNKKNGGYRWRSEGRYSADNNDFYIEHGVAGASGSETTSNYADAFYFYTSSGTYQEGIFVLYAVTK